MDEIHVLNRVSFKRARDNVRTFGYVDAIHKGFYIVVSDRGVRYALRPRDVTKECR